MSESGMLERLLDANEKQALAAGQMVEIQHQNGSRLQEIEDLTRQQTDILERLVDRMIAVDAARASAVEEVKDHIDQTVQAIVRGTPLDRRWWRWVLLVAVGIGAVASFLGINLGELVRRLPHG